MAIIVAKNRGWRSVCKRLIQCTVFACILLIFLAGTADAANAGEHTRHFNITYAGNSQPLTGFNGLGDTMENCYSEINGYYSTLPDHIKVLVIGKKTMDELGEHVEAFSAWNKNSCAIVLREETLKDKKSLGVVAKHELSHLGINNILANKISKEFSWMEEGTCMVLSKEPFSDTKVSKYIIGQGFLTPDEISKAVDSDNYNISKNGYMQSYSLMKYMVQKFGATAVINIFKSPETNFEKAFALSTGVDFGSFYKQWQGFVRTSAAGGQPAARSGFGYLHFDMDVGDCAA